RKRILPVFSAPLYVLVDQVKVHVLHWTFDDTLPLLRVMRNRRYWRGVCLFAFSSLKKNGLDWLITLGGTGCWTYGALQNPLWHGVDRRLLIAVFVSS